jgi:hypothetical protein
VTKAAIAQSVYRWATDWTIGVLRFESRWGLGIFLFTTVSRTALEPTQPPIPWVPGALSLGVKRPGREADHSPPSSAEVKNAWSCTSTPQYVFMAWCLGKHKLRPLGFLSVYITRVVTPLSLHFVLLYASTAQRSCPHMPSSLDPTWVFCCVPQARKI